MKQNIVNTHDSLHSCMLIKLTNSIFYIQRKSNFHSCKIMAVSYKKPVSRL